MSQTFRMPEGGLIDRAKPVTFKFNGVRYNGFEGDTLASALLANGVHFVGRSFKYHRPRGILGAGAEEANAMVQLREGARTEPNVRAGQIDLFDGLTAASQNCWPSLNFDLQSVNNLFKRLLPAGFYYKTFKWPLSMWLTYEHVIRNAAGMGKSAVKKDPDRYERMNAFCDVLVAGGGPAGLMAALTAARAGARVILAEETAAFGGHLKGRRYRIVGRSAMDWVRETIAELDGMANVTLLPRTTVASYYDHNMLVLNQHTGDHLPTAAGDTPRQKVWKVWATEVVLATGSIERPMVFGNNDRPGIMLASAAQAYVNQFAVKPGCCTVVFTNNDSGYEAAVDLFNAGIEVAAIVDNRHERSAAADAAEGVGIEILNGHVVYNATGSKRVTGAEVMALDYEGETLTGEHRTIACDFLCMAGGWTPSVHLFSQSRGKTLWDEGLAAFLPGESFQRERSAGACRGSMGLASCLRDGAAAGLDAVKAAGFGSASSVEAPVADDHGPGALRAMWKVPLPPHTHLKQFVDFQNDVAATDIELAAREGYRSVEHTKRYTTLGMGTDQGKTSNINGLAILAGALGKPIPDVGHTTFRPPYTAITFGAIAGQERGHHFAPTRRTPLHDWHAENGAPFVPAGYWLRAQYYLRDGEGMWDAIYRETVNVRTNVGLCDVSPLGKIDIQGKDAAEFLNRIYINGFAKLAVGKARYGVMLREDGVVFDDGTTSRLGENHFMMTTTTAKAAAVLQHMEYLLDVVWPELDVHIVSVTEEWCGIAVAGPKSRELLSRITDIDMSNDAFEFMGVREGQIADVPGRIYRISFSGELAYEVGVPADWGRHVWETLMAKGEDLGVQPYGMEAMGILRIEKGHVTGGELNGRTSAGDLGFGGMLSSKKPFIGQRSLSKPAMTDPERKMLVGLKSVDGKSRIPRGGQLVESPGAQLPMEMHGEVTANCYSPNLKEFIGLGIVKRGPERHGERLWAVSPITNQCVEVEICSPHMFDPEGERLRG
ncbi:MAG: sarcosine oxidase subunit alpha family protein [Rhodospirillales bacterium]